MSAEHPTPWHIEGQAIRDANGYVVVSAINPCNMSTRRQIVDAVNSSSLAGAAMEKAQTESLKTVHSRTGEYVPRAGEVENRPQPHAAPCRIPPDARRTSRPPAAMASGENRSATDRETPRKRCADKADGCALACGQGESSNDKMKERPLS